jgi:hypothetical protein
MTPEFLAAVKAGRIEGLEVRHQSVTNVDVLMVDQVGTLILNMGDREMHKVNRAHFCQFLRDWFTAKGWKWMLSAEKLVTWKSGVLAREDFKGGSPLDWHISAALHVLACEEGANGL